MTRPVFSSALLQVLPLVLLLGLTSCSPKYALGCSHTGNYFGGQGVLGVPRHYVPPGIQREAPFSVSNFGKGRHSTIISYQ